eukprot:2953513-Rhodomonas_salina.1
MEADPCRRLREAAAKTSRKVARGVMTSNESQPIRQPISRCTLACGMDAESIASTVATSLHSSLLSTSVHNPPTKTLLRATRNNNACAKALSRIPCNNA